MKKLVSLAVCAALAFSVTSSALAADDRSSMVISPAPAGEGESGYAIHVDGRDTGVRSCVMVPLCTFADQLGFTVTWNDDGTIGMDNGVMHTTLCIGRDLYQVVTSVPGQVGMSAPFSLGAAPFAADGTTYVPLELFEVLLGSRENAVVLENGILSISTAGDGAGTGMSNPFTRCATLAEAEKLCGFSLSAPETLSRSDSREFSVMDGMLEVAYRSGEDRTACIRKAPGAEDISGDYTVYGEVETVSVDGIPVTLKGDEGRVSLAIWTNGGYTYSVQAEQPVSLADMTGLVSEIR